MILDQKIEAGDIIVLDGATGTEVARAGVPMSGAAWCGVANKTHPDVVRGVHESYIHAGADVITTNTFATSRHVLDGAGLAGESVAINRRAVELALEARENAAVDRPVAVAGSMSAMRAWVPGSVTPNPRHVPPREVETANYYEMADTLAEAGVDLILMEMMLDLERATPAIKAAVATGLPVWIGISCTQRPDGRMVGWDIMAESPTRLLEGHEARPEVPLDTMIDEFMKLGGSVAGIMHSTLSSTSPGLEVLFDRWSGPVLCYPETTDVLPTGPDSELAVSPEEFAGHCRTWVERGVQIIGGCCGTTVEHIRQMVEQLPNDGRRRRRPR